MEGVLCTCSLVFFLLISSIVNASQGVFSEDVDLFYFSLDKMSFYKDQEGNTPQGSPLVSPSPAPMVIHHPEQYNPINLRIPPGNPRQPGSHDFLFSNPVKRGLNHGKMAGLVLISIAGVLQVVVLTYLLVKRRQMLRVVEKYEV